MKNRKRERHSKQTGPNAQNHRGRSSSAIANLGTWSEMVARLKLGREPGGSLSFNFQTLLRGREGLPLGINHHHTIPPMRRGRRPPSWRRHTQKVLERQGHRQELRFHKARNTKTTGSPQN